MQKQKKTTCNRTACYALQKAGILADGKYISHTAAVGGDAKNVLTKKNTLDKAMTGRKNLDLSKCDCVYLGVKNLGAVPAAFLVPGAVFIQDSNVFTYAGKQNGRVTNRSCNNAKNTQVKKDAKGVWRYFNNTVTSGYTFNQPILAVVLPKA